MLNIHALAINYSQLFNNLASWHGKIKKVASNTVHAHYDLFPPKDSNFSKAQTHYYVKQATAELVKKSTFVHSSKDVEVHLFISPSIHFIHPP